MTEVIGTSFTRQDLLAGRIGRERPDIKDKENCWRRAGETVGRAIIRGEAVALASLPGEVAQFFIGAGLTDEMGPATGRVTLAVAMTDPVGNRERFFPKKDDGFAEADVQKSSDFSNFYLGLAVGGIGAVNEMDLASDNLATALVDGQKMNMMGRWLEESMCLFDLEVLDSLDVLADRSIRVDDYKRGGNYNMALGVIFDGVLQQDNSSDHVRVLSFEDKTRLVKLIEHVGQEVGVKKLPSRLDEGKVGGLKRKLLREIE